MLLPRNNKRRCRIMVVFIGLLFHFHFHQQQLQQKMMGKDISYSEQIISRSSLIMLGPLAQVFPIGMKLKEESLLVETTLIVATVPYDRIHAKALWSHLECLTDKIDRVLLAAPDVEWSRRIVETIKANFMLQAATNRKSVPIIEPLYFDNNRYDVGLWCDALTHYGYSPNDYNSNSSSSSNSSTPQAIFLINDSAITRRNYNNLTERIIGATMQEQEEKHDGQSTNIETETSLKLLSLNGR